MMFFINNPWTLVISIIVIVFLIFIGIKIVREFNLNLLLKHKHSYMRVESEKSNILFKKRIGLLTSTALTPIVVLSLVLIVGSNMTSTPSGETRSFNASTDMESLYKDISEYLSVSSGIDYKYFPGDSAPENNFTSDIENVNYDFVDDFYEVVTTARSFGEVYGSDDLSEVVNNESYYFAAVDNTVEITINSNNGDTKEGTQLVDSIVYFGNTVNCNNGYLIKDLHINEDYLIVVALEYPSQCLGVEVDDEYLYDNLNVLVSVFNIDDINEVTNFRLSGNLSGIKYEGNNIYITTKKFLDYTSEGFDITNHLPFYKIDGVIYFKEYSDIIYVEGITPDSYTNVFGINIVNNQVEMETLLINYNSDTYLLDNEVQISSVVYYLEPLAGMFELDNPFEKMEKITFSFDTNDGEITNWSYEIK